MKEVFSPTLAFNQPFVAGQEKELIEEVLKTGHFCGDGPFTRQCQEKLKELTGAREVLLTSSCTHALEMTALLLDIQPGDEIIMPSFNFVSAANAFVLRGARIVFVDVCPKTMNLDEKILVAAITPKTKAIVVVHYGGVACQMEALSAISSNYNIPLIEDAAHSIDAYFNNQHLGTFGSAGTISFHSTKNIHCGEGGALLINRPDWIERAEILREKGTNRKQFVLGTVDKYTWVDLGSSYLMNELSAAFLFAQLQVLHELTFSRRSLWKTYQELLEPLQKCGKLELPHVPTNATSNAHIFFIKCRSFEERESLTIYLKARGIPATFHYVPLHRSTAGKRFGRFFGEDQHTTSGSGRLLRLPLYHSLEYVPQIAESILEFYEKVAE